MRFVVIKAHVQPCIQHTSHLIIQFTSTSLAPSIASAMAHYQDVDYSSEEVRSVASPAGFGRHGGVQQHVVKEKFEEVDKARESKFEEDINTGTGEFHERKENFAVRAD
ncbi:hypothetical protein PVAP13_5KG709400 [Panicum virgatum]|uniref:Uncharacterized protein n=1 Tax=Panicum virgatum TaxID=38727 RepID=A0A8T0T0D3_PANVG|nr:hypothetical protein PVAP13_5KG709400 [Panicum virgatum]